MYPLKMLSRSKVVISLSNVENTPVGIPLSYDELFKTYRNLIFETSSDMGCSLETLQKYISEAKVLEAFDYKAFLPDSLNRTELLGYLGLTSKQWSTLLGAMKDPQEGIPLWQIRPLLIDGCYACQDSLSAIYQMNSVLNLRIALSQYLPIPRPIYHPLSKCFVNHLKDNLFKLSALDEGPPKDFKDLQDRYGTFIVQTVRLVSKIQTEDELDEIVQHIWQTLITSRIIDRFEESARTKMPKTLTLAESLGLLGLTRTQWLELLDSRKGTNAWIPTPVRGAGDKATYLTCDIQTLDNELGPDRTDKHYPGATARGFKAYLRTAIYNHFKNLLRTRSRRHKERCLDDKSILMSNGSGGYHKASGEDVSIWEEGLVYDLSCSIEESIDLADTLRRKGVDPRTPRGEAVLDLMTKPGMTLHAAIARLT